jgi:hypothetical protein
MFECIRRGLAGWENFIDDNGQVIAFEDVPGMSETGKPRRFVSPDCLKRLRLDHVRELSSEIMKLNGVTSEIEKKLEGLLQQQSDPLSLDGPVPNAESGKNQSEDAAPAA